MEAAQNPQGKKLSVGDVISETFSIYGQNAVALIGSALVVFVVVGIIAGILQSEGGAILLLLGAAVRFAGQALYTGFVVGLVSDVRDGRRDQSVGDLMSAAMPVIVPLVVFGILFGIGVAIGLLFLIIPGLILITFWSVGAPAIVVEGAGPIEAFGRSWNLVRGDAWSVFATLIVVLIILIVIGAVLAAIGGALGTGGLVVGSIIAGAITAPIWAIAVSVIFFDLGGGAQAPPPASEAPTAG
jgi:hypothetical protein